MSSQLVMMPCSTGYFRVRMPLLDWASSPANPALHMPEPLSQTRAATSSSHMVDVSIVLYGETSGYCHRVGV